MMDDGHTVDVIDLDFAKAFDDVLVMPSCGGNAKCCSTGLRDRPTIRYSKVRATAVGEGQLFW